jgi:Ca2+-binding RTX toxin-like protein
MGFDNWTDRLDSGAMQLSEVVTGFVRSPEFQNTYGNLDNAAFVTLLYDNVLDRDPDATGLTNWTASLDGGMAREQVVIGFSESAEFRINTSAEAYAYVESAEMASAWADDVYRLYQATLDREPDITGLENWSGRLGSGMEFRSVVSGFVNSQEFQNTYGALGNSEFVTLLYNNVLDRAPDATGLTNWTARLDTSEMSREQVVEGFSQSPEFIRNTAPGFDTYISATEGDTFRGGTGNDFLYGGMLADEFDFDVADTGNDRVLQLDVWDTLSFTGFGYADASEVLSQMQQVGEDVIFFDQDVSITFMRTDVGVFGEIDILV